jgi:MFS transporter, FLVCR family, MFS-domain-containing protein 7
MLEDQLHSYRVYPWRYLIVFSFVVAGAANALVLLSFAPISAAADSYWRHIGYTCVNLLAVMFQIAYIPGTSLALAVSKYQGLKAILICGGCLTSFGCLVRWIGAQTYETSSYDISASSSYAVVLLGTFFVALAQPFYLNLPAKITAAWFPVKERDLATTICSLANPLGSAMGSLLPPMFVTGGNDDGDAVNGVASLLLLQFLVAVTALFCIVIFFASKPPTPPSNTESKKFTESSHRRRNAYKDAERLLVNPEYLKLWLSFSIALGNLNALAALLGQLPGGYSDGEYGITGFALILTGFAGAFFMGLLLEKSKAYRPLLKMSWIAAVLAWILFVSSCRVGKFIFFMLSAALLGFSIIPISKLSIIQSLLLLC